MRGRGERLPWSEDKKDRDIGRTERQRYSESRERQIDRDQKETDKQRPEKDTEKQRAGCDGVDFQKVHDSRQQGKCCIL